MKLIYLCRRANKNPSCLEKRTKASDMNPEEDSPPGAAFRLFLMLMAFLFVLALT